MKTKNRLVGLLAIALLVSSCGKDYLNTSPTDATPPETVFLTTDNAMGAVQGLHKAMYTQYQGQGSGGEGSIKIYGEKLGDDSPSQGGNSWYRNVMNLTENSNESSTLNFFPWFYYYKIIANANLIIVNIDKAEGPQADKDMIKAQALTYRAYCHFMICQMYGPRYIEANKATLVAPLMMEPTTVGQPKSSMTAILTQVNADLTEAITLFTSSKYVRKHKSNLDLNVANGIKARVALYMGDYGTAAAAAVAARQGYPLMSNADYKAGFNNIKNPEWIWGSEVKSDQTLYFYGWQAYMAYNASSSYIKSGPVTISKVLYNKISATDIRKELFLGTTTAGIGQADATTAAKVRSQYDGISKDHQVWWYMNFKFRASYLSGGGDMPHIRSAEMYLIEAEANARLGGANTAAAQKALFDVVSPRDPSYTLSAKTGDALLDEILFYRRVELWGEGFRWFDMKRMGQSLDRAGADKGGNYTTGYLFSTPIPASDSRWILMVPKAEVDANPNL